jgi:hypothetical protein
MENILGYLQLILIIVSAIGLGFGTDLKKWHGWLYVLCAFMSGLLMGINIKNLAGGTVAGIIFALLLIIFGPIMLKRRKRHWDF